MRVVKHSINSHEHTRRNQDFIVQLFRRDPFYNDINGPTHEVLMLIAYAPKHLQQMPLLTHLVGPEA